MVENTDVGVIRTKIFQNVNSGYQNIITFIFIVFFLLMELMFSKR